MTHDLLPLGADALPASGNLLNTAGRTADITTDVIPNLGADGLIVVINAVKTGAAPSVVFTIQGVAYPDGPNGAKVTWDILASAAVVATGVTVLQVSPNLTASANAKANALMPDRFQVVCDHTGTDVLTYSVTAILTP